MMPKRDLLAIAKFLVSEARGKSDTEKCDRRTGRGEQQETE